MKIIKSSFAVMLITLCLMACKQQPVDIFDKTYVHVVYFWFNNPDSQDDKALFEKSLKKFLDHSAYAKTNFIGTPPKASRDVVDDSYTYNLILTFESAAAQEAYQNEDVHNTFVKESSHLWKKVIVYDAVGVE